MNSLETNEKTCQQKIEVIKNNQMEIILLKYKIKEKEKKRKFRGQPNSRMDMVDDRIHELECRSIEFTQSEQERENRLKKNEQFQRPVGQ